MEQLKRQVSLFLAALQMEDNEELREKIESFFSADMENKHLILKRSILYFYNKYNVEDAIACAPVENQIFAFDGVKVSRIKPEMYLGDAALYSSMSSSDGDGGFSLEVDLTSNNNNNNNNNGNNNG